MFAKRVINSRGAYVKNAWITLIDEVAQVLWTNTFRHGSIFPSGSSSHRVSPSSRCFYSPLAVSGLSRKKFHDTYCWIDSHSHRTELLLLGSWTFQTGVRTHAFRKASANWNNDFSSNNMHVEINNSLQAKRTIFC